MKDRLLFFGIGAVVVMLTALVLDARNESKLKPDNMNPTFESVTITGSLVIGKNKDNFIVLETNSRGASLIIDSEGSTVLISTNSDQSSITQSKKIGEFVNIGSAMSVKHLPYGKMESHIVIRDTRGQNIIRSTD